MASPGPKFCTTCGTAVTVDSTYCAGCGTKVVNRNEPPGTTLSPDPATPELLGSEIPQVKTMSEEKATRIRSALGNIDGISKWLSRKEFKELPRLLWEDELPEAFVTGVYQQKMGMLVATNKRAIFIDKGWFSLTVEDSPYDKISSIEYHTGIAYGDVRIYASGNKADITRVPKNQV